MKNVENKWIGWVEDGEGYMVRFIGPTSQGWAARKCREAREVIGQHNVSHISWTQLDYALTTKFANFGHTNTRTASSEAYYSRLPITDLNVLISVIQG